MQKRMILFSLLESPRTDARIGSTVLEKTREYNIKNKVVCITLDNVSAHNVVVDILK